MPISFYDNYYIKNRRSKGGERKNPVGSAQQTQPKIIIKDQKKANKATIEDQDINSKCSEDQNQIHKANSKDQDTKSKDQKQMNKANSKDQDTNSQAHKEINKPNLKYQDQKQINKANSKDQDANSQVQKQIDEANSKHSKGQIQANTVKTIKQSNGTVNVGRTPMQELHEFCAKHRLSVQYNLTASLGEAHQGHFIYHCIVSDVTGCGEGDTKKSAKHKAAAAVLKILETKMAPKYPYHCQKKNTSENKDSEAYLINPVSSLQQLAFVRRMTYPKFCLSFVFGPSQKQEFYVCCKMEGYSTHGAGFTEKQARRNAAFKMFYKLLPQVSGDNYNYFANSNLVNKRKVVRNGKVYQV